MIARLSGKKNILINKQHKQQPTQTEPNLAVVLEGGVGEQERAAVGADRFEDKGAVAALQLRHVLQGRLWNVKKVKEEVEEEEEGEKVGKKEKEMSRRQVATQRVNRES